MLSRFLLCLLLLFTCFLAIGQGGPVSGKVVGYDSRPLAAATVTLLRSATDSFKTLTDSAGLFSINTTAGPYRLVITHAGYAEHRLENPSPAALRLIQLIPAAKALDAVVVKADVPLVEESHELAGCLSCCRREDPVLASKVLQDGEYAGFYTG